MNKALSRFDYLLRANSNNIGMYSTLSLLMKDERLKTKRNCLRYTHESQRKEQVMETPRRDSIPKR
jgi:hypothetical protein